MGVKMFYIKTENVDKLCVPFGVLIGPCTVLSNIVKLIGDIAIIVFNGLLTINYAPSQAYTKFKAADLAWEKNISSKYKPYPLKDGSVTITFDSLTDPEYSSTIFDNIGTSHFGRLIQTYRALSSQDRRQIGFERAKQDFVQHFTFVGIGVIRSIPLVGGTVRWIYNIKKQAN